MFDYRSTSNYEDEERGNESIDITAISSIQNEKGSLAQSVYYQLKEYVKNCLKTLDIELNLMGREFKSTSGEDDLESIEGLFKIIFWHLEKNITTVEFTYLYSEWAKHKKISDVRNTVSIYS